MPRRNLNQSYPHGRICGTPSTGVKGSLIPSTGVKGPGFLYRYLSLPADNDAEFSGYITSLPPGVTFTALENSEFLASGPDGVHIIPVDVRKNGIAQFTSSFNLVFGSTPQSVSSQAGDATASGSYAAISQATIVMVGVGAADAVGAPVNIEQESAETTLIEAFSGNAQALGQAAEVQVTTTIGAIVGAAIASGHTASVSNAAMVGRTLTDADVAAIAAAIWAHPDALRQMTMASFMGRA